MEMLNCVHECNAEFPKKSKQKMELQCLRSTEDSSVSRKERPWTKKNCCFVCDFDYRLCQQCCIEMGQESNTELSKHWIVEGKFQRRGTAEVCIPAASSAISRCDGSQQLTRITSIQAMYDCGIC